VQLIRYRGWPLALAEADGVYLHPTLEALAECHEAQPLVRLACALALHVFEVERA
jgi:hypothetical protein